jgi:hypothetical protein
VLVDGWGLRHNGEHELGGGGAGGRGEVCGGSGVRGAVTVQEEGGDMAVHGASPAAGNGTSVETISPAEAMHPMDTHGMGEDAPQLASCEGVEAMDEDAAPPLSPTTPAPHGFENSADAPLFTPMPMPPLAGADGSEGRAGSGAREEAVGWKQELASAPPLLREDTPSSSHGRTGAAGAGEDMSPARPHPVVLHDPAAPSHAPVTQGGMELEEEPPQAPATRGVMEVEEEGGAAAAAWGAAGAGESPYLLLYCHSRA